MEGHIAMFMRCWHYLASFGVLLVCLFLLTATPLQASASWYVAPTGNDTNSCNDPSTPCQTITGALNKASANDTIFLAAGRYHEPVAIGISITIIGAGMTRSTLDGDSAHRIMTIQANTTVRLAQLAFQHGAIVRDYGGSILNAGSLTFDDGLISNSTGDGAAIQNAPDGMMVLNRVIIQDNLAYGVGGIHNEGQLQLTDSLIQRNATQGYITDAGGGIQNTGVMTATGVTFRDNHGFKGGALYNVAGKAQLTNSTLIDNTANEGGAIYNDGDQPQLVLTHVTMRGNTAANGRGGSLFVAFGIATLANSILTSDSPPPPCPSCPPTFTGTCFRYGAGTILSRGSNIADDTTCELSQVGDREDTDPLFGPLQIANGPTVTYSLLPSSPAIDAANPADCVATDQRNVARPVDGNGDGDAVCDIGAYEYTGSYGPTPTVPATLPTPSMTPTSTPTSTAPPTATVLPAPINKGTPLFLPLIAQ